MTKYVVRKQGRTFGIFRTSDGYLVEGGFFTREAAVAACAEWNAGANG